MDYLEPIPPVRPFKKGDSIQVMNRDHTVGGGPYIIAKAGKGFAQLEDGRRYRQSNGYWIGEQRDWPFPWIRHTVNEPLNPTVVTCVYCGHQYPEGTPTHQAELLTAHIKLCDKHPMREAEARIARLRKALAGVVGAESKEELEGMKQVIRMTPVSDAQEAVALDAIDVLLSEMAI